MHVGSVGVIQSVHGDRVKIEFPGGGTHLFDLHRVQLWKDNAPRPIPPPPTPGAGVLLANLQELLASLPKQPQRIEALCVNKRTYKFLRDDLLKPHKEDARKEYSGIDFNMPAGVVRVLVNENWPGSTEPVRDWEVSLMDGIGGFYGRFMLWNKEAKPAVTMEEVARVKTTERANQPKYKDLFEIRRKKARWNII